MQLQDFLDHVATGAVIEAGSDAHQFMHGAAQEALQTTAELNAAYHTPDQVRTLLSRLTGRTVDDSVVVFPPFYTEFGKNLTLGRNVFVNITAPSRTPAASPSATTPSSATAPP